jgi:preprotein translocase subunit SecF
MSFSIVKPDVNINFIGVRKIAFAVSIALILLGLVSLVAKGGPRYGVDFAGGVVVQVDFEKPVTTKEVKSALDGVDLPGLIIQQLGIEGGEYLVRTSQSDIPSQQIRDRVQQALTQHLPDRQGSIQRLEMVGPKVGSDLRSKALEALYFAVLLIAIYISGRFEQRWFAAAIMAAGLFAGISVLELAGAPTEYLILAAGLITLGLCWYLKLTYALGAPVALVHDLLITVGVFSLLNKEFDLTIVAALLTIIGYSLNDTIIVFDRIRENIRAKKAVDLGETINKSINQTLSRTLLTSGTTLLVVLCLYLFGGGVIHDFALALLVGIVVGTYSSIFVASPILLIFGTSKPKRTEDASDSPAEAG